MGFFDALIDVTSAGVKAALTPVAVVADVAIKVTTGENPGLTNGCIEGVKKDLSDAIDEIVP